MNIINMHSDIRVLLDNETSPRYNPKTIDVDINQAIDSIVGDRYLNEKKGTQGRKGYSFQSSSKLRDQLFTLIKTSEYINAVGDLIPVADFPADYNYLINVLVNVSGIEDYTDPISYSERTVVQRDPKLRPTIIYPPRLYSIESADGIQIMWGPQGSLIKGKLVYLKKPALVSYGVEISNTEELVQDSVIIAVTDCVITKQLISNPATTTTSYVKANQEFEVTVDILWTYKVTQGIAVKEYTNCDLPPNLHAEIVRRAAANISGAVENFDRKNDLNKEDLV